MRGFITVGNLRQEGVDAALAERGLAQHRHHGPNGNGKRWWRDVSGKYVASLALAGTLGLVALLWKVGVTEFDIQRHWPTVKKQVGEHETYIQAQRARDERHGKTMERLDAFLDAQATRRGGAR